MDEQSQQKNLSRYQQIRVFALLSILVCSALFIAFRLSQPPTAEATDQSNAQTIVELEDPMPPLEVDLIPWQDDESIDQQASHQQSNQQTDNTQHGPRGRVLIVRGILTIFSLGMDDLAKKMRKAGYEVKVTTAAQSSYEARSLRDHVIKTDSKKPVIIIGHSLGGDLAPGLARVFAEKGMSVDVLFMLDSTMPSSPPSNVKVCVNMYQDNGTPDWARVFRGTRINSHSANTRLINVDIKELADKDTTSRINHFNIDANPWIHKVVINMVGKLLPNQSVRKSDPKNSISPIRRASQIPAQSQRIQPRRR